MLAWVLSITAEALFVTRYCVVLIVVALEGSLLLPCLTGPCMQDVSAGKAAMMWYTNFLVAFIFAVGCVVGSI